MFTTKKVVAALIFMVIVFGVLIIPASSSAYLRGWGYGGLRGYGWGGLFSGGYGGYGYRGYGPAYGAGYGGYGAGLGGSNLSDAYLMSELLKKQNEKDEN